MQSNSPSKFLVVLLHVPPFVEFWDPAAWSSGDSAASMAVQRAWIPLFERYRVHMVVSGHSHIYQRGIRNGIRYVIIGGGGGSLDNERVADTGVYSVTAQVHHYATMQVDVPSHDANEEIQSNPSSGLMLRWRVFDTEHSEIDSFTILEASIQSKFVQSN